MRNFAEHQEAARKQTRTLVWLFIAGLIAVTASLYGLVGFFTLPRDPSNPAVRLLWDPQTAFIAVFAALGTVGLGSLLKHAALASGGRAVAESVGGRLVTADTSDPEERKLLNVVEEMSIASGVPMPLVYVLEEEEGINAFAAGYSVQDAAVAVTRGGLRMLNRAELQGVMAHEFSHILNGDMRISIRLISAVAGIEAIAGIGRWLLSSSMYSGGLFRSRRRENGAPMLLIGIAMFVIGAAGIAFGHLIRAAISRQREFLADASAVQFTRDPSGIASALKKIGGFSAGSRVKSAQATELSHLFFGDAERHLSFGSLMATHPPLAERIRRLEPDFDGTFQPAVEAEAEQRPGRPRQEHRATSRIAAASLLRGTGATLGAREAEAARVRLDGISEELKHAARQPLGAAAIVVLTSDLPSAESSAGDAFAVTPALLAEARRLAASYAAVPTESRLALVQLACGALRQLGSTQAALLLGITEAAMLADNRLTPFEVCLREVLHEHLGAAVEGPRARQPRYLAYRAVAPSIEILLSCVAHLSGPGAPSAFREAAALLPDETAAAVALRGTASCGAAPLSEAIRLLARASTPIRERVLEALAAAASSDGTIGQEEADLVRAVALVFQLPVPLPSND